jgi:hypothetical protein
MVSELLQRLKSELDRAEARACRLWSMVWAKRHESLRPGAWRCRFLSVLSGEA